MNTEIVTPKLSRKELHLEALKENIAELNDYRVKLYHSHKELEAIGGTDNYADGLFSVVTSAGESGITLAQLHEAFPDIDKLKAAKDYLVKEHKVMEKKDKMTTRLTVKVASGATENQEAS